MRIPRVLVLALGVAVASMAPSLAPGQVTTPSAASPATDSLAVPSHDTLSVPPADTAAAAPPAAPRRPRVAAPT